MSDDRRRTPASWPESAREAYEERAAIIEYEGGVSRRKAELLALEIVRVEFGL